MIATTIPTASTDMELIHYYIEWIFMTRLAGKHDIFKVLPDNPATLLDNQATIEYRCLILGLLEMLVLVVSMVCLLSKYMVFHPSVWAFYRECYC